ncbi:hypothetical protein LJC40_03515 [Synergistaceae bacterium OttesenSCG-928-D05]|nr:hypothetical protein [Synergistaceae bacterium OttesenSCG-928-D05]
MPRQKKTEAKATKRIRRSPEILLKELDKKMKKLEERIYKSNKELVHHIGVAILKCAKFDLSTLTEEDMKEIADGTPKGSRIIQDIVAKAHENQ